MVVCGPSFFYKIDIVNIHILTVSYHVGKMPALLRVGNAQQGFGIAVFQQHKTRERGPE